MTVSPEIESRIRRLFFAEHWKRGTIVTQLGLHDDVIQRVIGPLGNAAKAARVATEKLDPFLPFIFETLEQYPRLRATRLFDMIVARGYDGSLRTLRRYVSENRPRPKREVFLRFEPLMAEQAQVDWAHVGYLEVPGGRRPLWAFVMVLSYSRAMWGEFVMDLSVYSLLRSLVRASEYFGGSPRQWLFDNPKTIVLERHGDAVRFHPKLLNLAATMHVEPRLCGVRKPQEKGRVERAIRYLRERFLAARRIHSIEQGNCELLEFMERIAMPRPHPRYPDRTVADLFSEEKPRLLALPSPLPATDLVSAVVADKTAFIRFDLNAYSVPVKSAHRTLTLAADDSRIRLLDGTDVVAEHARNWGRHQRIERPEHRAEILAEKRRARDLKGRDRLRAEVEGIDPLFERWVNVGRNIGSMTVKTIVLLNLYGAEILTKAVRELLDRGHHDPGALAILCEKYRCDDKRPVVLPVQFANHVEDRDVIPHDLGGYDER